MELFVVLITAGFHFFLAYLLWKKEKVHLLAGYVEGQVKDKKRLSKYSGILFIGLGIISVFFPLASDGFFYYVFGAYILWLLIGIVVINVKIK